MRNEFSARRHGFRWRVRREVHGDAPVQAYIAVMPGWKRGVGKRLDSLIVGNVPDVRKAVRWNTPFYRVGGQGWFLGFHTFTNYVQVAFFCGTSLRPIPPLCPAWLPGPDLLRLANAKI